MRTLWRYIQVKENRELLAFICGGFAAVVTAGWVAYSHFSKEALNKPQTTISAPGGVASGSITSSPITINTQAPPAASGSPPSGAPR